MSNKNSAQNIISSYRKRQQMGPYVIGGIAILLAIVGIIVLVVWLTGPNHPKFSLIPPSATPTATATATATATVPPTATATATIANTATTVPTATLTATPSGPFEYVVQEGETCYDIALKYKANLDVLIALNPTFGANCSIKPGDKIQVPNPNQKMPTPTPIDISAFRQGQIVDYTVASGDTLAGIASRFNSTVDAILKQNATTLKNANSVQAGQVIKIPVNIATPTPTIGPTSTRAPSATPKPATQAAPAATATATKQP
jgi:LysM repeat protein